MTIWINLSHEPLNVDNLLWLVTKWEIKRFKAMAWCGVLLLIWRWKGTLGKRIQSPLMSWMITLMISSKDFTGDFSPKTTRNWILPTTWMSLGVDFFFFFFCPWASRWELTQPTLISALWYPEFSQAVLNFWPIGSELINGSGIHSLSLW